ncbi:MAG: hypothetical protein KDA60_21670, partial [Planctomycetales bacterium]|nr:hypothetical protein [Planctomycetales bacterium]
VVDVAHEHGALVKVIFENDYITDDQIKVKLCQLCEKAGAEYVKTSTGFGFVKQPSGDYNYAGATLADIQLMRATCSDKVQVKAAGGVRTYEDAVRMRDAGAARLGASATETIVTGEASSQEGY